MSAAEGQTKQCSRCKQLKTLDQFGKKARSKDGLHPSCGKCKSSREAELRSPAVNRFYNLKKKGLTPEVYAEMLARQGGVCAICGGEEKVIKRGRRLHLAIDHCHITGVIRGLLCSSCNRGIGKLKDSPDILKKALLYLLDYEVYKEDYEDSLSRHRVKPEHSACVGSLEAEREYEPVDGVQLRAVLGSEVGRREGSSI